MELDTTWLQTLQPGDRVIVRNIEPYTTPHAWCATPRLTRTQVIVERGPTPPLRFSRTTGQLRARDPWNTWTILPYTAEAMRQIERHRALLHAQALCYAVEAAHLATLPPGELTTLLALLEPRPQP